MRIRPDKGGQRLAKPEWSVVITTRNRAQMLSRAIGSCVNQTSPCEIIVIDEASSDSTPEVIKGFPSVQYVRNSVPLGHSASANKGIRLARTEWVKPLDDDDWLSPNCIELMSEAIARARSAGLAPAMISGVASNVDFEGREVSRTQRLSTSLVGLRSKELLKLMMIDQAPIGTPVQVGHGREAALGVGGWNEKRTFHHQHGDEVELWIKLAAAGDAVFVPELVGYRTLWAGGSQDNIPPEERYRSNIFLKEQIATHLGTEIPRSTASYLALHWALVAIKEKEFGQAFRLATKWVRRPASAVHLLSRRGFKHAEKRVIPL